MCSSSWLASGFPKAHEIGRVRDALHCHPSRRRAYPQRRVFIVTARRPGKTVWRHIVIAVGCGSHHCWFDESGQCHEEASTRRQQFETCADLTRKATRMTALTAAQGPVLVASKSEQKWRDLSLRKSRDGSFRHKILRPTGKNGALRSGKIPTTYLLVAPSLGVVRPDLSPDLLGKCGERQQVHAGVLQMLSDHGELVR
jgi:hypothetical protein